MSKRIPILMGLLLTAVAVWCLLTGNPFIQSLIERLDNLGYDLQLRTRVLTQTPPKIENIAIVDIDDKSLKAEGQWPWPRNKVALLTNKINELGAVVIAFDMFFSEKEENIAEKVLETLTTKKDIQTTVANTLRQSIPLFDNDVIFANSLKDNTAVLAFSFLPRDETQNSLPKPLMPFPPDLARQLNIVDAAGYISNLPILQDVTSGGFINIFPDADGIIRRAPMLMSYKSNLYPSLALQAVMQFLSLDVKLVTPKYDKVKKLEGILLGTKFIPTNERSEVLIPFIGKSFTFPYYSAVDLLQNKVPKDKFVGKIILVGTSATGLSDLKTTSIQSPFPGVEVQAALIQGMLVTGFSYAPAWTLGAEFLFTLALGILASLISPYFGPRILGTLIIGFPILMLIINNYIWVKSGLVISFLMPVILFIAVALFNIIYGYLFETRKREHLKEMFGQYVPEKHIDEMLKQQGGYGLRGEDREMSVLFADIRSFTTISEGMTASDLVDMLNTFFTPMTEVIFKHRGTIDKYVGDLIMAFWGAPLHDRLHARHAIESALGMRNKVKELYPILAERKWPEIHIGMGINSGVMSVGDMGSRYRRNYTVLGDSVNLASRVESLSKFYGVDIVITESTREHQTRFIFRMLDKVQVKGKKQGIAIYEVIGRISQMTPELKLELEKYENALSLYYEKKWDEALALMEELHQSYPETKIYKIYIERIKEYKIDPPAQDWNGVFVHHSK